jgi:hypothetical protein
MTAPIAAPGPVELDPPTREFYRQCLRLLNGSGIPYAVGGAYALDRLTGIARHTKDLDVFVTPADAPRVLCAFADAGHRTEMTFPHWLGKVFAPDVDAFLDVIFRSGNGLTEVDESWLRRGVEDEVVGEPVRLSPPEEMIWSKAFVMERERFDGADIAHLIRALGDRLDWARLLDRFGAHWRVLLCHLILFGYVYPGDRDKTPRWVEAELLRRLAAEGDPDAAAKVCQGTFLSREQYLVDLRRWGYRDARLDQGSMSPRDVAHWTAAIGTMR